MLKKFMSYYRPHVRLFTLDMCCAFIVALCNLFYPFITKNIINDYVPNKNLTLLIIWLAVLLIIYIIKALLNYIIQYWGHIVGVRIQGDMRKEMFRHLQELPFSYFDENKTGTIMSRIINDLMDISELAHHGPEDIFLSLISLIGAGIMMAITVDVWLTVIVFIFIPFFVLFAVITRKGMHNAFQKMREKTGEINASVESSIAGMRVSKAYTAANYEIMKFESANEEFKIARGRAYRQMGIFHSGMSFLTDLLYLIVLIAGGLFFYFETIDIGQFTAYILYITMIISPLRTLISIFEQIQSGMTGFARFQEIMQQAKEAEPLHPLILEGLHNNITFDNVSFQYTNGDTSAEEMIIQNLSLRIEKGTTIALVGPSGGGKTTLCHLIPRFYEVTSGKIMIDDIDIKTFSQISLRKQIGIVAQDVFLFSGSIKENIAYGNLDASDEDIIAAAKQANIHDFILSLENDYYTYVGERGVKLSGGQKQRIAIARAFLKNPPILILDEATSALDNATEMQIQQSLETLSKGRTTIVVAHRLSTIKNADKIIVITHQGIEESGTHAELLQLNGTYASLYRYQFERL